jgi:glycerol-1-phosphate dehydrogenase [NAD(P)+]
MEDLKMMVLPRNIIMGSGVVENIAGVVRDLGLPGHAFVICDEGTLEAAGRRVIQELEADGIGTSRFLVTEADRNNIDRLKAEAGENVFLVGVGGGRPIDVAKVASSELGCQFISVPTAASHDGVASDRASIIEGGQKMSSRASSPIAVVADLEIISRSPRRLWVSGFGDVVSNKTAVLDWRLANRIRGERVSYYAAALSALSADVLIESSEVVASGTPEGFRILVKSLVLSSVAMSLAGSSRPASGAEHLFSHSLDRIADRPALHGEQCGVGSIIMMYLHGGDWSTIRDALRTVGAPVNAVGLGMDEDTVIKALVTAHEINADRYTILDGGLDQRAAVRACKETGVIS